MDRVTIIGGSGFIGDYLVDNLKENQKIKVKVIYKKNPPTKLLQDVEYLKIDGSQEPGKLKEILEKTDYLIILSRPDKKLIENIINDNIRFSKILYASTILIYPSSDKKQTEDTQLIPANDYEAAKIEEEIMLSKFAKQSGNNLTIARLTNVYGDIKNRALIHWILKALVDNTNFKLNNRGEPIRDFIFVEDVASFLVRLIFLKQLSTVEIFNVCTGNGFSINEVIKTAEYISGKKIKIIEGDLTDEKLSVIGDNSKLIMETGLNPKYTLKSGLEKAYQNYLNAK